MVWHPSHWAMAHIKPWKHIMPCQSPTISYMLACSWFPPRSVQRRCQCHSVWNFTLRSCCQAGSHWLLTSQGRRLGQRAIMQCMHQLPYISLKLHLVSHNCHLISLCHLCVCDAPFELAWDRNGGLHSVKRPVATERFTFAVCPSQLSHDATLMAKNLPWEKMWNKNQSNQEPTFMQTRFFIQTHQHGPAIDARSASVVEQLLTRNHTALHWQQLLHCCALIPPRQHNVLDGQQNDRRADNDRSSLTILDDWMHSLPTAVAVDNDRRLSNSRDDSFSLAQLLVCYVGACGETGETGINSDVEILIWKKRARRRAHAHACTDTSSSRRITKTNFKTSCCIECFETISFETCCPLTMTCSIAPTCIELV